MFQMVISFSAMYAWAVSSQVGVDLGMKPAASEVYKQTSDGYFE